VQAKPAVALIDTNAVPVGSASCSVTLAAFEGPALVSAIV
jgi:hypothetical protein